GKTPQLFDDAKGMFAARADARALAVDQHPASAQRVGGDAAPIYAVTQTARQVSLPVRFAPVSLVTEDLALATMQQGRHLRNISALRIGRDHAVYSPVRVSPDMQLHAEVPAPALARRTHLRVALLARILGRTRRGDNGRIHDRTRVHQ